MIFQGRSKRKYTGKLYRRFRKKRKYELGREYVEALIGERKIKKVRVRGGNYKIRIFREKYANVYVPAEKKVVRAEIKRVIENKAHIHYARRNVLTKGAVIETSVGKAVITSRPGQDGVINAVLVE